MNSCRLCKTREAWTACRACEKPVCEGCCRLEIVGSGCGCVWPVYYCLTCLSDPLINPNALLREPEQGGSP